MAPVRDILRFGGLAMSKVLSEKLITPEEAGALVPAGPVDGGLVRRWLIHGVRGVRLEGLRRGGRWFTSAQAVRRFFDRLNEPVSA
jgi:hypothetical protein